MKPKGILDTLREGWNGIKYFVKETVWDDWIVAVSYTHLPEGNSSVSMSTIIDILSALFEIGIGGTLALVGHIVKTAPRPNNIGIGIFRKNQTAYLGKLDKAANILGKVSTVVAVISTVISVVEGIKTGIDSGYSTGCLLYTS